LVSSKKLFTSDKICLDDRIYKAFTNLFNKAMNMKKVAIIGAGIGGLAAAYDLIRNQDDVTIFEAQGRVGGLAGGFKDKGWDWWVDKYYHHWFLSDHDILDLIKELGWKDKIIVPHPRTVVFYREKFYPLDSPLAALTFPGFTFIDMIRFGFVSVYLRYFSNWKPLEKCTADEWMKKAYGQRIYSTHFEPLLIGKFGEHYKDVTMAWFWARFKARTTRLATFEGGFQEFTDLFAEKIKKMGVKFRMQTTIDEVKSNQGKLQLATNGKAESFDQVLITTSPQIFARIAKKLPKEYLSELLGLQSMGAVVLVLSLKHQLSKEGYYWFNLPKQSGFPFLALVDHTNFVPSKHFGGDHIVYCGDYLDPEHEYFRLTPKQLIEHFTPGFKRINPEFNPGWIKKSWLWKTHYAQPIPLVNHSRNIPAMETPIPGVFFASMSQVYPWDRGTNFAVQIGRAAACMMIEDGPFKK
jgi:protoporphyrinogen oxidase